MEQQFSKENMEQQFSNENMEQQFSNENDLIFINNVVINAAIRVFKILGPGHNEKIYHKALVYELNALGYILDSEMNIVVKYEDSKGFIHNLESERIDIFLKEKNIILELKAIQRPIQSQEFCQIKKYFNELNKLNIKVKYGVIINFLQPNSKEIPKDLEYKIIENNFLDS